MIWLMSCTSQPRRKSEPRSLMFQVWKITTEMTWKNKFKTPNCQGSICLLCLQSPNSSLEVPNTGWNKDRIVQFILEKCPNDSQVYERERRRKWNFWNLFLQRIWSLRKFSMITFFEMESLLFVSLLIIVTLIPSNMHGVDYRGRPKETLYYSLLLMSNHCILKERFYHILSYIYFFSQKCLEDNSLITDFKLCSCIFDKQNKRAWELTEITYDWSNPWITRPILCCYGSFATSWKWGRLHFSYL